jgi:hypothetical protein
VVGRDEVPPDRRLAGRAVDVELVPQLGAVGGNRAPGLL